MSSEVEAKWVKIGSFLLSGEKLNDVLVLKDGKVSVNSKRYVDCLTEELSIQWPGRYTSKGQSSKEKSSLLKLLFRKSCYQTGCAKQWRVTCGKECFSTGVVNFIVETNDVDCYCVHRPEARPLTGK